MDVLGFRVTGGDAIGFQINGRDLWDIIWLTTGCGCTALPMWYIAKQPVGSVVDETGNRRRVVHVCCCGESCARLTANVDRTDETVVWSELSDCADCRPFEGIGPFTFARAQYDAVLVQARRLAREAVESTSPSA